MFFQTLQISAPLPFYYRAGDVVNTSARLAHRLDSDDSLSVQMEKYWSALVGKIYNANN